MVETDSVFKLTSHDHMFLGKDHDKAERRTWAVIVLCTVMMIAEIVGGALFGSLALIADGLHMSTHAGALLLAALAYTYARKYAEDRSFTFGTGKFGDLAGYSSAIVLAMIALLIGYEAVARLLNPVPISFNEAIPIAVVAATTMGTRMDMTMIMARSLGASNSAPTSWKSRYLKKTCRHTSVCARKPGRCLTPPTSRSRPSVRTAAASYFHSTVAATIWSRATKFRNHMPSLPWFA